MSADEWLRNAMDDAEAAGHIALLDVLEDPDLTDDERRERITGLLPKPTPNGVDYALWRHFVGVLNSIPILTDVERRKHLDALERIFAISPPPGPPSGNPGASRDIALVHFSEMNAELNTRSVIKGLINASETSLIVGPTQSGKTFFTLDLALHAAGKPTWRGLTIRNGSVVYIAAEAGRGVINRIRNVAATRSPPLLTSATIRSASYLRYSITASRAHSVGA